MELVTIHYTEFKRLVAQESRLKDRVAELEEEVSALKADVDNLIDENEHLEKQVKLLSVLEDDDEEEELLDE
ncbi:hypothetical protein C1O33_10145 [Staphylococcus schleiferi]|uniref:hypothetical protein n=1 Tax=Staphylococcus sp. 191 TaxID=2070016 RepID=UPI0013F3A832|nr:hypothetical protein [Staphylococcus sp. 191]NHA37095.1 hypothetical protein [Staphylococcus schleiferi]NHB70582.1 hypothetical protein [Staphylococcus sp. 191]